MAGKCIFIFVLLLWFILSKQATIFGHDALKSIYSVSYIAQFILSGDLCSLAFILMIRRGKKIDLQKPEGN